MKLITDNQEKIEIAKLYNISTTWCKGNLWLVKSTTCEQEMTKIRILKEMRSITIK
jgi:hypothetical protein